MQRTSNQKRLIRKLGVASPFLSSPSGSSESPPNPAGCHLNDALGLLETIGLAPTLAALDTMEKCAQVSLVQCELNDYCGVGKEKLGGGYVTVIIKGDLSAVTAGTSSAFARDLGW